MKILIEKAEKEYSLVSHKLMMELFEVTLHVHKILQNLPLTDF